MPKSTKKNKLQRAILSQNKPSSRALVVPRGLGPIEQTSTIVRLPFAYSTALGNDGSTIRTFGNTINLGVTNAYSPISGTHQPYGWDQMAALYRFYKVVDFKYKVTIVPYIGSEWSALGVRPVPVNENSTMSGTGLFTQIERPDTKVVMAVIGAGKPPSIGGKVNIPKLMGVTPEQWSADVSEYAALCTAAPNRYPYIQIAVCGSATTTTVFLVIECEYTVHFWQRITQAAS